MGWFKQMFGGGKSNAEPKERTVDELRADPDKVSVFDEFGRELFLDKQTWRRDVLPEALQKQWSKPDELYSVIVGALNDGFRQDVLAAARRLYEVDPDGERSSCILGIVLMSNGKLDEAEGVLTTFLKEHGDSGVVLTNLAKVQADRGDNRLSEDTLWRALEVDPNQSNGVEWWAAIHHERSGKEGYVAALKRVAEIDGSWRAQTWLAREALERGASPEALGYYRDVVARVDPVPNDIMSQISGDLGNAGLLREIVELLGPRFDAGTHGLMAGNNLIKAYVDLGDTASARQTVDALEALNRPDWREHLAYWDDQIDQMSGKYGPADPPSSVAILRLEMPVWAHKLRGAELLLPKKADNAPRIAFISSTVTPAAPAHEVLRQKSDLLGTLSRGIPLFRKCSPLPVSTGLQRWATMGAWMRHTIAPKRCV